MPRLFIGTLADIDEQKRTEQFLPELNSTAPAIFADDLTIKFTAVQNLHMTWAFIGDVPQDAIEQLSVLVRDQITEMRPIKLPPQLQFDSIEFWPNEIHPTLLVLTPSETPQPVQDCAQKIHHIVSPFKSPPEVLPFRAHITLARLKKRAVSTDAAVIALKSFLPFTLKLTDIGLFESISIGRQSVYRTIARYEL
ncbi:MAG: RNA 2',3'-cyclic phosphodiesterase [Candidatus Obscuribacterales bacterium]|nr:RNA 2',3'-cyclic phosphodiesterase [Candidatus Obscuribacterales bacterium]